MADLKINPAEIQGALANFVKSYDPGVAARDEVGTVSQAGDGIARVEGLPSTMANELLQFENGTLGLADLILYPIVVGGYNPDYRPFKKLVEHCKIIDIHIFYIYEFYNELIIFF